MNTPKFVARAFEVVSKHSPDILMGLGIAGMLSTTVLAVKATPKALERIDEAKKEKEVEKLTPMETIKATWKCYIPPVITGVISTACLLCMRSVNVKRNAALATAYKLSETALSEYRDKVVETIGEKKEQAIKEKVAKDRIEKYATPDREVYETGNGETLFLDPISKRVFRGDIELVRRAVNNINYSLTHDMFGYVSLNEFYDEIGLERTSIGDNIGWKLLEGGKGLLEVGTYPDVTKDGKPCLALDYQVQPKYGYADYYSS